MNTICATLIKKARGATRLDKNRCPLLILALRLNEFHPKELHRNPKTRLFDRDNRQTDILALFLFPHIRKLNVKSHKILYILEKRRLQSNHAASCRGTNLVVTDCFSKTLRAWTEQRHDPLTRRGSCWSHRFAGCLSVYLQSQATAGQALEIRSCTSEARFERVYDSCRRHEDLLGGVREGPLSGI